MVKAPFPAGALSPIVCLAACPPSQWCHVPLPRRTAPAARRRQCTNLLDAAPTRVNNPASPCSTITTSELHASNQISHDAAGFAVSCGSPATCGSKLPRGCALLVESRCKGNNRCKRPPHCPTQEENDDARKVMYDSEWAGGRAVCNRSACTCTVQV